MWQLINLINHTNLAENLPPKDKFKILHKLKRHQQKLPLERNILIPH